MAGVIKLMLTASKSASKSVTMLHCFHQIWLCGCCLMLFVFVDSYWHRNRNFSPNSEQKNAKSEELNWRIWTSAAEWAQPLGELLAIFFGLPLALSPAQLPMSRLLRILLVAVTWSMGRWEYTKDTHHTPLKTYEKD